MEHMLQANRQHNQPPLNIRVDVVSLENLIPRQACSGDLIDVVDSLKGQVSQRESLLKDTERKEEPRVPHDRPQERDKPALDLAELCKKLLPLLSHVVGQLRSLIDE